MTTVVHLSDLHLLSGVPESEAILAALLGALARERAHRGRIDLVAVSYTHLRTPRSRRAS